MSIAMSTNMEHLAHASARAARRQGYLAGLFATYLEAERINADDLRRFLGCSEVDYFRLSLCRVVAQPSAQDLEKLAEYVGADLGALAQVIRRVEALEFLRQAGGARGHSTLLAARERED